MGSPDRVIADDNPAGPVPMTAMRSGGEIAEGISMDGFRVWGTW